MERPCVGGKSAEDYVLQMDGCSFYRATLITQSSRNDMLYTSTFLILFYPFIEKTAHRNKS